MICEEYSYDTPMPFGKYVGQSLGKILRDDPSYFMYLWNTSGEGTIMSNAKLAKWIKDNLQSIQLEIEHKKQQRRYERK